jgi:hypothetical protein
MAKAAKKAPTKRKLQITTTPITPELWVLNPTTGKVDKTFIRGDNCTGFEYNEGLWFKVHFEAFSIETYGIPFTVVDPK